MNIAQQEKRNGRMRLIRHERQGGRRPMGKCDRKTARSNGDGILDMPFMWSEAQRQSQRLLVVSPNISSESKISHSQTP